MLMRKQVIGIAAAIVALLSACARPGTGPSPAPEPTPAGADAPRLEPPVSTRRAEPGRWSFQRTTSTLRYRSQSSITTELVADTGARRTESRVDMIFRTSSAVSGGAVTLSGAVEALQASGTTAVRVPLEFRGVAAGTRPLLALAGTAADPASIPDCSNPAFGALAEVRRMLVVPPPELASGTAWQDSSKTWECRAAIAVNLTAKRTFDVTGEVDLDGNRAVEVRFTERTDIAGEGPQGQHRVAVSASGTREGLLYLDPTTGALLRFTASGSSGVTVRASGRATRFRQTHTDALELLR